MQWNPEYKCFVDYMGMPLTKDEVRAIEKRIRLHLGADPEKLAELANVAYAAHSPGMAKDYPITSERFY